MRSSVRSRHHLEVLGLGLALSLMACRGQPITLTALSVPSLDSMPVSSDAGLAVAGSGEFLLSWIGGDSADLALYVSRSADSGRTWSAARVAGGAGAPGEVHPHGESSPRLVAGPAGRVAIVWANSIRVASRKWPAAMMRLSHSTDGGESWSPPVTLNDDTTGALVSHQFHGAAWSGDSGLEVAWLDERASIGEPAPLPGQASADPHGHGESEPDATIYLASSPDFGKTWTSNRPLWGAACPCCRVSLSRGTDGAVQAAWRKHFPGNVRDVVVTPLGAGSPGIQRVHHDAWVYPGCPHTGPAIAAASGGAHVVWYTGKSGAAGVFYARQGAGRAVALIERKTLPPGHVTVAALADGGALAAYDVDGDGSRAVTMARIDAAGRVVSQLTVPGSNGGTYPQVAAGPAGALVAWTEPSGGGSRVRVASVSLGSGR